MASKYSFKNLSIFHKIALLTITLVIFTFIISDALLIFHFTENIKAKDRLLVQESSRQIEDFMREKYNMIYNQRILIHSTDNIASIITSTRQMPSDIYQQANLSRIISYLTALAYSDDTILDTILFTADGKQSFSYSNLSGRNILSSYPFLTLPYIQAFEKSSENITVINDTNPPYFSSAKGASSKSFISFIAKIYDTDHPMKQQILGYLMINFSSSALDSAYQELDFASDGSYFVINENSDIIYCNQPEHINQPLAETIPPLQDIVLKHTISLSNIQVIGAVSDNILLKNLAPAIHQVLLLILLCITVMLASITMLHRFYAKKFRRLAFAMDEISHGSFSITLPVTSEDEIGYLSRTFNTMSQTLNAYIEKTYVAETQRRTAELHALQAQINPHFLANTIESIRMKASADGNYEVSQMLANLGNLFRWIMQFHDSIIYVEDELDYIKSYLELQEFRFGGMLDIDINASSDILYLGIPKFTLQPVVENCLSHNAPRSSKPLSISICLSRKKNILELTVQDDGDGMDADKLQSLMDHITGKQERKDFGIALQNVNTRIRLLFGEPYGLSVTSIPHSGTKVTVTMPALEKKEMANYV